MERLNIPYATGNGGGWRGHRENEGKFRNRLLKRGSGMESKAQE